METGCNYIGQVYSDSLCETAEHSWWRQTLPDSTWPTQALIVVDRSCINTINQWGSFNETDLKDQSVTGSQCVGLGSASGHTQR